MKSRLKVTHHNVYFATLDHHVRVHKGCHKTLLCCLCHFRGARNCNSFFIRLGQTPLTVSFKTQCKYRLWHSVVQ